MKLILTLMAGLMFIACHIEYMGTPPERSGLEGNPSPSEHPIDATPPPLNTALDAGIYRVGSEVPPGVYAMSATENDWCSWKRMSGATGDVSEIISDEYFNVGQSYFEVLPTDAYLEVSCPIASLDRWPVPLGWTPSTYEPGKYLVGREIRPGTYRGEAGEGEKCYWERLSGLSATHDDVLSNHYQTGQFYVTIKSSDVAFNTTCVVTAVK